MKREFLEETGLALEVKEIAFVNKEFVPSMFHSDQQVISIYFYAKCDLDLIDTERCVPNSGEGPSEWHMLQWKTISELSSDELFFPIDKQALLFLQSRAD